MIGIYDINKIAVEEILDRTDKDSVNRDVEDAVDSIIADVRTNGDLAVRKYTEKFDGSTVENLLVSPEEKQAAMKRIDENFMDILRESADNIRKFHSSQKRTGFIQEGTDGRVLGQKITPISKVGIYVPGGTARYPSSVLMNAIPAKIAGVEDVAVVTPPDPDGSIPDAILAAAEVAGVDTIYKMGGAQAIAALAYGTETVKKADKIVGPGNIFVAEAKRKVFGTVAIDMIAGPSEILVLADETANPVFIAADMLSQAEHDKRASAVLVCMSKSQAEKVAAELERQVKLLPRREIAETSLENYGKIIVTDDMNKAVDVVNEIAPEHLEICTDNPFNYLNKIKNAGSIFLGKNVPEALGDYLAGPNHTLPTSGTAKFSSPLSVDDFVKKSQFIYYSQEALAEAKDKVAVFARVEGLDAHARSVEVRFEGENNE